MSTILLEVVSGGHPRARLGTYHVADTSGPRHAILIIGLHIVATCGPLPVSRFRTMRWFGAANVVAVVTLALLCASVPTSLRCFYAVVVSVAIGLHLRMERRVSTFVQ